MRFASFFIERPVFASVCSLILLLVGGVLGMRLPISEFPEIVPPTVTVQASYPGASAEVIAETVATPLEQEINGVDGMLYMTSQSTGDGNVTISVVFRTGTDIDEVTPLVQSRVSVAEAKLPDQVRQAGLKVRKTSPDLMMVVYLVSPHGTLNQQYLSNYATLNIKDALSRLEGVGDIYLRGQRDYALRVWLDPGKLSELSLSPDAVIDAIKRANAQVSPGVLNSPPGKGANGAWQLQVLTRGRLTDVKDFANIAVSSNAATGATIRLRDIARVELAAQDYNSDTLLDGSSTVDIGINQKPGSNALETADRVLGKLKELKKDFPADFDYHAYYNPTEFVRTSIENVFHTLLEATVLVALAVMLFLKTWRAAIIPILAIPISLLGTMALMPIFGVSLNNLSLFGMVLAIGIVVDDAIVVVENVERHIAEGLSPLEASHRSMAEVGIAVIAIALVLIAVFIPAALVQGIVGMFFKQFAVTIALATAISAFVSLTLSPALAAKLFSADHGKSTGPVGRALEAFDHQFARLSAQYGRFTAFFIGRRTLVLLAYVVLIGLTVWRVVVTPHGFVPQMDRGYAIVSIQLPPGSTLARTSAVALEASHRLNKLAGVAHTSSISGVDGATFTNAPNAAVVFAVFDDFSERVKKGLDGDQMLGDLRKALAPIAGARILVIPPPAVAGIGTGGGFKLFVRDRAGHGAAALQRMVQKIGMDAAHEPAVANVFSPFNANSPSVFADIDPAKAEMLGLPLDRINSALTAYLGSYYVNDFNLFGRIFQVDVQADQAFRRDPSDITSIRVRSNAGVMIPLGSVATVKQTTGPFRVARYNLFNGAEVQGAAAPGYSTGQAIAAMESILGRDLEPGYDFEWTELALQEKSAGGSSWVSGVLAVLFVFLVLAALYESWLLPLSVILIVPMCLLAALVGVSARGSDVNVLTQVAFVVLIGLAAKNAILIIEFAMQAKRQGMSTVDAAIHAAHVRFRPIMMTSIAFILGVIPLVLAKGAGAEMRQAMGTAVFFGMIGVTVFGLIFTPVFFFVFGKRAGAMPPKMIEGDSHEHNA
ncbi:HAE1 family hydrophobic/amphiphilic exporter-1 [Rhodanobacter sp. K2T2]|uniref:efflux RND transporter permease subunit n=1 Tax=Rhodanobacter sp. K2T2 TaxID=2723085 RepID=UPI0015CB92AE|nr:efflux RND transporter permease subunit [Rhodanobacter sp. K2T2]NYE27614.1 HAE1 family hydrophobic/amphiphilic exporter-1 [Rhodanobacter sp. K2T2]